MKSGSPLRRKAMCLTLAELNLDRPQDLARRLTSLDSDRYPEDADPLATIARILVHRRVRDIVRALHPSATGLMMTLSKLDRERLFDEECRILVDLHTKAEHRPRVRLFRHMQDIPTRIIPILAALEPPYVILPVLLRLQSVEEVTDFQRSIALIRRVNPSVSDQDLVASLSTLKDGTTLGQWVKRWLSRATTFWLSPPITDDGELVYLNGAAALRDAGRRFKNCLGEKTSFCALGRAAFLEFRPVPVIVELQPLDRGYYVLERMYGPENAGVDAQVAFTIIQKLRVRGVLVPACNAEALPLNRIARLTHVFDAVRDDLDLFDDEIDLEPGDDAVAA